jgi:hypothetical protein
MEVQEHRNGIRSIEVQLIPIPDKDGNELNKYYGRNPTYIDADGNVQPVRLNLIEGEARRLITAKRAIAVDDIKTQKPNAKRGRPPANKKADAPINK